MSILRSLFGPTRDDAWRQFCSQSGAHFIEGGFWKRSEVEAFHRGWKITLDTYTVSTGKSHATYTRIRAPFSNPHLFRFTLHRKGLFSDIARWLGLRDVEVGHPAFDEAFVIKGNDHATLVALLANPKIRELIEGQPRITLRVRETGGWPRDSRLSDSENLCFTTPGVIKDVERLKQLFALFEELLDTLCSIGVTSLCDAGRKPR
jgi:hypothetical protein